MSARNTTWQRPSFVKRCVRRVYPTRRAHRVFSCFYAIVMAYHAYHGWGCADGDDCY